MNVVSAGITPNNAETLFVEAAGAQCRLLADAAHGFLFQYPTEVAAEVNAFLAG
jgi:hypothetical protein